jgi:Methyltransferase domain
MSGIRPAKALLAEVEALMDRLFVAAPGARLREEDRRKAVEVAALLVEIELAAKRRGARAPLTLVDAAAGKTYVGLLAAKLILAKRGLGSVVAIEREPARAAVAAQAAQALSAETGIGIEMRVGDVGEAGLWPPGPDIVTALHACGPAADLILDRAIAAGARQVLVVPCCTSESVQAMGAAHRAAERTGLPRHAAVQRRYLQAFVDAERTLRLEAAGYETEVVELCPPTVTPHNLLWRARRVGEPGRMREARARWERLLNGDGAG